MEAQMIQMKSSVSVSFPMLPDFRTVLTGAQLLKNYYSLYLYYFYGTPLPTNFPTHLIAQFPNMAFKGQLKNAISLQTSTVYGLMNIQNQYLVDYYSLYTHYSNGSKLPSNFPKAILDKFPSKNHQKELRKAIVTLQNEVLKEKEAM